MSDNVELNAGSGGDVIAADDVAGVKYQVVKLAVGGDGAASLVANGSPIPVSDAGGALTVDGAVTANAGTNLNTSALALESGGNLDAITSALGGTLAVSGPVTDTELRAAPVVVDLGANNDVTVTGSVAVTGTFWQATQPVSGTVTANAGTNLNTSALALESGGNLDAIAAALAGTLTVDGPLTDTELRASAVVVDLGANNDVTVTGSVTANAGTNLNTSALALETGGNLAAAAASLALLDNAVGGNELQVDIVSAPTLTVNAHAVTNAGTFAVQVDGSALTALQLIDDPVATLGTTTYSEASTKGMIVGAVRRDADTTLVDTTNEVGPLQMDANGRLKVEAFSGETLPVSLASVPSHAVTNAGTFVTQENGSALTALQLLDDCIVADDATFTPASTKVSMCGFTADEASTDSIDEGDGGAARMTLDRKQIVTNYAHAGAGGATPHKNLDVDESEDDVKTSAGKLFWLHAINLSSGVRYLKFYNATAANVTVGTTTPVLTFPIPTFADTNGAGFTIHFGDVGLQFDTAICIAATTGLADNNTGAPGANEVIVNLGYL